VLYRPYTPEDFVPLYAIEEVCFQPPHRFSRRYMQQLVASSHAATWIAEEDGRVAGFAIVEWTQESGSLIAYILTIEVAPEQRGHGTGSELLRRIEDTARSVGAQVLWLHVDVENRGAIRLYQASGYRFEGEEKDYYGPDRPALIYAKLLAAQQANQVEEGMRPGSGWSPVA
jgi:ribosomal protein S18 acetylase RimI-like enzyme